ncbi:putative tensin phosphatase, C2 domain, formin, FH2 domain, protein-tyrosine phosphatase [Helianthus annuus]|nr:putative tensin phosphatase, C2 domain, formin, FH2 domain, protein-tyrosine phosphatase [Helianthus annuus]
MYDTASWCREGTCSYFTLLVIQTPFNTLFLEMFINNLLFHVFDVYLVFDCCLTTDAWEQEDYKNYVVNTITRLKDHYPDASILIFNFGEKESSQIASALSDYDLTIMDYPRQYEGCPLLPMEVIHHFLRSSESWLSLGQQNILLMHCERGGWPVLAYMLAALLIYRKHYTGEYKTLDMVYKQAPHELLQFLSPLNPLPSQLRYLQYVSRRNVASEWPPSDRALILDCVIIRAIPDFDGNGGCCPIFRIYGRDPISSGDKTSKLLFSTPKKSKNVRYHKQAECELIKIDINCRVQGDIVLECISLHNDLAREKMMYRAMFNTAFIRSNILMLSRDEIDILWDAKDLFPKDFRAELLFSDMDAAASTVPLELAGIEAGGLPIDAFDKIQEIFNSVDLLDPKSDAALNVLHQLASSKVDDFARSPPLSPSNSSVKTPVISQKSKEVADNKVKVNLTPHLHSPSVKEVKEVTVEPSTPTHPKTPPMMDNIGISLEPVGSLSTGRLTESPSSPSILHRSSLKKDKSDHKDQAVRTATSTAPPPPPPPRPAKDGTDARVLSLVPPPPPPPASRNSSGPPPPPPPLFSGKGNVNKGVAPPPPPPRSAHVAGAPSLPPPMMKGRSLSKTGSLKAQQSKKLKPLHWLKLTRAVSGSLWAETQKSGEAAKAPEIDISELESLFSAANPKSEQGYAKSKSRAAVTNKPETVQLIDHRRAYNCEIMLSKVKIPLNELMEHVLALEDSAMDADQVDNLIKFYPTKEEMELLQGYKGEKDRLGKCEQFFLELMKVPRTESKLRVFSFKLQFNAQVSDLRKSLNIVNSAVEQTRSSGKLKRVMQTILQLGNALNQGTARGSAIGFRLDSLLKLADTRARNNRMTLMHYLCKVLADKLPEVLDFSKDLSSLEPAAKIQLKFLAEEMQAIIKGLEKVGQELSMSENDGPVSESFRKALKEFLCSAEGEARSLASLYSSVGKNVDALIIYFGEDPARCPYEQVVTTLLKFVRMFNQANEENAKQLEAEKKKAEKEASNEKLKQTRPNIKSEHIMPQSPVF